MKSIDASGHVQGKSLYIDDISMSEGTLHLVPFGSPIAHGTIKKLDVTKAESIPGVVKVFTAKDIPGVNQIGGIIPDEPLLAENKVMFQGQPVAFVVATSEPIARSALASIVLDVEPLPVTVCPREAHAQKELLSDSRTFALGDPESVWDKCEYFFEGQADSKGQEHLYIETNGAYCVPTENGTIKVYSSSQGALHVHKVLSKVLKLPMQLIEVEVIRLGGGFGGKEDQAAAWAAMSALASLILNKPVKCSLHRIDDMRMTGKRHPYRSDYKIGLSKDLKIMAYEASFFQNGGAFADLSPAVLERTLFHGTSAYHVPHVRLHAHPCRTNLPSNTAFRGFGGPQSMFVMEAAIHRAATEIGVDVNDIQKTNLVKPGDEMPYGQKIDSPNLRACWDGLEKDERLAKKKQAVADFNQKNTYQKKGFAIMPICFGISFTKLNLNQASALVHIYTDGGVALSTCAIEMGQGVNTKMMQVVQHVFGLPVESIRLLPTNTTRTANPTQSAASSTADLNGFATLKACNLLKDRLLEFAEEQLKLKKLTLENGCICHKGEKIWTWQELINNAYMSRVKLSEFSHYATPKIHFDATKEKGHPFAYYSFGCAAFEVTLDCLRGRYVFDEVHVVHDFGKSFSPLVDLGQMEGGLVQGMGWMTMEDLEYDDNGRLLSNALSTYKVPDVYFAPEKMDVDFLEGDNSPLAILNSKAIGEPPLLYGIGAYFALTNAIKAYNPNAQMDYASPMTPEKALMALHDKG